MGPLRNGGNPWLIDGGDPNHLLIGMILQVPGNSAGDLFGMVSLRDPFKGCW